jgi:hypothetical protein
MAGELMTSASKRKGDQAEREIAHILTDQLGPLVRRRLGAGRRDDTGDLDGLAHTTVEVKAYADIARAVREGLTDCAAEQTNAGTPFGVAFIRRPGGRWFAAMTVEQWCAMYREAT